MRVTRTRKDFGSENVSYIERDAGEQPTNIAGSKQNFTYVTRRKVLDIGLQSANVMKVLFLQLMRIEVPIADLLQQDGQCDRAV